MDDILKLFGVMTAIGMAGASVYAVIALVGAFVRRLEGRPRQGRDQLEAEVADLRARLDESDQVRARVAELEERLDFTERMLARQREADRLGTGGS